MDQPDQQAAVMSAPDKPAESPKTPVVGIFDSGIGGFTVARAILKRRPDLDLVYFGDTLNMPYGGRSPEQLARFASNSIEFLLSMGMDILAVGCNASNSVLGQSKLNSFGKPAYDLVSSTIDHLRGLEQPLAKLALVATKATINARYWQRKLTDAFPELDLRTVAAREFVPLVEDWFADADAALAIVRGYFEPLLADGFTTVLHGCTHFPLLEHYMAEVSEQFSFLDPAELLSAKLVAGLPAAPSAAPPGALRLYSSLPNEAFYRVGEQVFGRPIRDATKMYVVNPYED